MRLLVLGGTAWLGGTVAAEAVRRGHEVVCLARGLSGAPSNGVRWVRGDRDHPQAYDEVAGERWNAVLDVSRQPGQVRGAVSALAGSAETFVFVSSGNVYSDTTTPGDDETAALLDPLAGDVMESMETYGAAKVACEQYVLAGFGSSRSLIVRSGLIGGPGDTFDRTGYWPLRFARPAVSDGRVLVPDAPRLLSQVIDVRDLAAWLVTAAESRLSGVYNATGPTHTFASHLAAARSVAGHTGSVVSVSQEWLLDHDVEPWAGPRSLPLWLPVPEYEGFTARDGSAARALGLASRPLEETLADTLQWELERLKAMSTLR